MRERLDRVRARRLPVLTHHDRPYAQAYPTRGTLPDCSRDSRAIAFVRDGALYTIYSSGRGLRRLTPRHIVDGRPAFSPAGGLIAVTTTNPPDCDAWTGQLTYRLELIDLRGRRRRSYLVDRQDCAVASPETFGARRVGSHCADQPHRPLVPTLSSLTTARETSRTTQPVKGCASVATILTTMIGVGKI